MDTNGKNRIYSGTNSRVMSSPFATEKELFLKLASIESILETMKRDLATKTKEKSEAIRIPLGKFLAEKCRQYIQTGGRKNFHECRQCGKIFDEGRKLGGHVLSLIHI